MICRGAGRPTRRCRPHAASTRARTSPSARSYDLFGIDVRRPPRPHAHPHARRLGGPPAAQGLPARARPGDVQGRPGARDERSTATTTSRSRTKSVSSARPTRARRSCAARDARARDHRRRHVARARRRERHDDHQHGSAAPVDPRRAAAHDGARRRRGRPRQAGRSATSTPAWRRPARSSRTCRAAPTSPAWTTRRRSRNELVYSHGGRAAARRRGARPRAMWIRMMLVELNRIVVAPAVPGDERHGHRRGLDDALRLARARRGAAPARDDHRPADEPQLHPPRRRRRRPARRLAGASARTSATSSRRASPSTTSCSPRTRSGASARSASASSPPRSASRSASPVRSCARPGSPGTCARRSRTSRTTRSTSTSSTPRTATCFDRYRIRLYEIARVDQDRAPVRGEDAAPATTACRTRRSRRRRGPASTSRWKR